MMLFHEHDEDPKMRPKPISPEKWENIKAHIAAGLLLACRYFRAQRQVSPDAHTSEPRRSAAAKVGGMTRARADRGRSTSGAAAGDGQLNGCSETLPEMPQIRSTIIET
jgi:hypothetical protein